MKPRTGKDSLPLPYTKPVVRLIVLRPEESLMACRKLPPPLGCLRGTQNS